jgi:hypothetical protein
MALGDVKFIGWTGGGTAPYKEQQPQVQFEPTGTPGLLQKRVTINRICYDKDKQAVIGNLPTLNATLTSVFVDATGATQTAVLGGGYTLLSVSDSSVAKGISRISAQYTKTTLSIFELGLPAGFSVDQVNGVCRIKYLDNVLEEFDSGTGQAGAGLEVRIIRDLPDANQLPGSFIALNSTVNARSSFIGFYSRFEGSPPEQIFVNYFSANSNVNQILVPYVVTQPAVEFAIYCNDILFENVNLNIGDLANVLGNAVFRTLDTVNSAGVYTEQDLQAAIDLYTNPSNSSLGALFATTTSLAPRFANGDVVVGYPDAIYLLNIRSRVTYLDIRLVNTNLLYPRWSSSGNTHKILIGGKTWREYDVTGLT